MACGSCGGGPGFTPSTYKVTTSEGKESTFLTKTQAIMSLQRAGGGGKIETIPGKARQ